MLKLFGFGIGWHGVLYGALAAAALGAWGGWWVRAKIAEHDLVAALAGQLARQEVRYKIAHRVETKVIERVRIVRERGKAIVKEVPVYVTVESDERCTVPRGFVRVHDAAASGEAPGAPARSDGEAAGVALSRVADTVAENYTECRVWREQVIGWQEFYRKLLTAEK